MKWPWQKKPPEPDAKPGTDGAKARAEAEWHLAEVNDQWTEVRRVSASLRDIRSRNHFGETIERIMRGKT
jgi:hypothetical protein